MKLSTRLLTLTVAAAPVAMFAPGELARQFVATIAALALFAVALEAPPGLLRHLARVQRPWIASFACAAAYLAAQILPIASAFIIPEPEEPPTHTRPPWLSITGLRSGQ